MTEPFETREQMERAVGESLAARGLVTRGDRVVIVTGNPGTRPGQTNNLHVLRI
jgi:pyruvate kinase